MDKPMQDERSRRCEAAYQAGLRLRKYIDRLAEAGLTIADVDKAAARQVQR